MGKAMSNIEDKSEIVQLDLQALEIRKPGLFPPAGTVRPAIDAEGRRLFSVCSNKKMAIVNADSGQVVATVTIGTAQLRRLTIREGS
jgi:hypothetical protein